MAQLPEAVARVHHGRLARILEATPDADPEAIASHLLGAGDKRARGPLRRARRRAGLAKLAFAQAARLFQLTLDAIASVVAGRPPARAARRRGLRVGRSRREGRTRVPWRRRRAPRPRARGPRAARSSAAHRRRTHRRERRASSRRVLDGGRAGRCPTPSSARIFGVIVYRAVSKLLIRSKVGDETECSRGGARPARRAAHPRARTGGRRRRSRRCTSRRGTSSTRCARATATHVVRAAAAEASSRAARGRAPSASASASSSSWPAALRSNGRDPAG